MKRLKWLSGTVGLLCVIALIFEQGLRRTGETDAPNSGRTIRVITYNVQFLPGIGEAFNKRPNAKYRVRAIADCLGAHDIIGLCEVFAPAHRKALLDLFKQKLGSDFSCVVPNVQDRSAFGIDSGLVLITRLPVIESHTLTYGNDSPVSEFGVFADGFAAKGALHARIRCAPAESSDFQFDVFLTHLESRDPKRREQQFGILAKFIQRYSDVRRPLLLMGDLNTVGDKEEVRGPNSQYQCMMVALNEARPSIVDLWRLRNEPGGTSEPESPDGGQRIDYLFLANPGTGPRMEMLRIETQRFPDPTVGFLSDHCALSAELRLASRTGNP